MSRTWKLRGLAVLAVAVLAWRITAGGTSIAERRATFTKAHAAGNFKDAYEGLRKLALDPQNGGSEVGKDLELAINCLQRLGRVDEIDEFREAIIAAHKSNWRLLATAAETYVKVEHYGYIVAGKFERGHRRGGARYVNVMPRDRTRALQLMQDALAQTKNEQDKAALASFHIRFADMLITGAGHHEPWRLQYLTDLTQLPDYDAGNYGYTNHQGAPVDADGNPVFHKLPKGYDTAESDGERWRWLLTRAAELDTGRRNETDMIFADFLRGQFGVQTMASYGRFAPDRSDDKSGTYALHTLTEKETIARLASGVRRFEVPDEFSWIRIYREVAARGKTNFGSRARDTLAQIFEDRRQYVKAAEGWKTAIADYGPGNQNFRQTR